MSPSRNKRCRSQCDVLGAAATVDYAYQPIINMSSLQVLGFEALARVSPDVWPDVGALLDAAYKTEMLFPVENLLLRNAIGKYARSAFAGQARLFCNVDNRIYASGVNSAGAIDRLIGECGLPADSICLEVSERSAGHKLTDLLGIIALLKKRKVQIALDDFGIGVSGLQMLLTVEPHYIKIDQCFIAGLTSNLRKQAIVAKLCGLSRALNFLTIAEGIENEHDFRTARDLGCDFGQGYHIARPTTCIADLALSYGRTVAAAARRGVSPRVGDLMRQIAPLFIDQPLFDATQVFDSIPDIKVIPIVNRKGNVEGVLREQDVQRYLLSDFGRALLTNRGAPTGIQPLVRRCTVAEADASIEVIVNSYVAAESADGLVLASAGRFIGYLSNNAILRLAADHEVTAAREQNPLTLLPGNQSIAKYVSDILAQNGQKSLIYFDLDHFKAFNDYYGFSAGDRMLLLFAQLLRSYKMASGAFIGHIGGDDFFVGLAVEDDACEAAIIELCLRFAGDAESLYSAADRARGGIVATDRFGVERHFPLLRVSASILHLPRDCRHLDEAMVQAHLSAGKQVAKRTDTGIWINRLPEMEINSLQRRALEDAA